MKVLHYCVLDGEVAGLAPRMMTLEYAAELNKIFADNKLGYKWMNEEEMEESITQIEECKYKYCGHHINTDELYAEVEEIGKFHIECFYKRFKPKDKHE